MKNNFYFVPTEFRVGQSRVALTLNRTGAETKGTDECPTWRRTRGIRRAAFARNPEDDGATPEESHFVKSFPEIARGYRAPTLPRGKP